jgi:EmrB/QacA subfamily drug resistance transporter
MVISQSQIHSILASLILVMFMGSVEQAIVSPALPEIAETFHNVNGISWVVTIYLLCATPGTLVVGKLSDIVGRQRVILASLVIFLAGSLICAAATSLPWLIAGRFVQGAGGAGLISLPNAVVGDIVSPRERGKYQVYISGTYGFAGLAGPICGGLLTSLFSWRAVFWAFVPLTVFAMIFVSRTLRVLPVPTSRHRFDYLGAALMSVSMACLLIAVEESRRITVEDFMLWTTAAMILGAGFVFHELRAREPLLRMTVLQNRIAIATSAGGFLVVAINASVAAFLPMFYELRFGFSTSEAGFALALPLVGVVLGQYTGGQYMRRCGRYRLPPLLGTALAAVVNFLMAASAAHTTLPVFMALTLIGSFGAGACLPPMLVAAQNAMPGREMGVATSLHICSRSLGGMTGVAMLGMIVLSAVYPGGFVPGSMTAGALNTSMHAVDHGFSQFFLGCSVTFAAAFVVLFALLKEREFRRHGAALEVSSANRAD